MKKATLKNALDSVFPSLSDEARRVMEAMDGVAGQREKWTRRNWYYHEDLKKFFRFVIPEGRRVLEIGCGIGDLLSSLRPSRGLGIDISGEMVRGAQKKHPDLEFRQMNAQDLTLDEQFDYVIISDTLGYLEDIQKAFRQLHKVSTSSSRIVITFHSFLWAPVLRLAESLKLKMPQEHLNWLNRDDIAGLLALEGFEIIKKASRLLFPKHIPLVSALLNRYVANLPVINRLCITGYIIARPAPTNAAGQETRSVSVVVPSRNERGNIESLVRRLPEMGTHTEVIFVEGHSTDGTLEEIKRICQQYRATHDLKYAVQDGVGKADAVRKGFSIARGDILMILDADLTVPPEELPKFYRAITSGKGEFVNGSRLVYPMEADSMRALNILGNKFFYLMFSWLLGQRLKDTLCGTKVISRVNYEHLVQNRKYFGEFDPFGDFDLLFGSAKLNLKIVEVPIRYRARTYGSTNISRFKHGWLLLKMTLFAMNKMKFI